MIIEKRTRYQRDLKKLIKSNTLTLEKIEECEKLFEDDYKHNSLRYHSIKCKKDKNRYSITVPNTQYRILMSVKDNIAYFKSLLNHNEYDRINKNC